MDDMVNILEPQLISWAVQFSCAPDASKHDCCVPGIYALWLMGVIVYVGKAEKSISARIIAHAREQKKAFDKATFIQIDGGPDEIALAEEAAIREIDPEYNFALTGGRWGNKLTCAICSGHFRQSQIESWMNVCPKCSVEMRLFFDCRAFGFLDDDLQPTEKLKQFRELTKVIQRP